MALTNEVIVSQQVLSELSEEQIAAIVNLSQNDEEQVIGKRIGEIYREMDNTIAESTGISRNGDEKTYLYLKRAANDVANRLKDANTQIADLTKERQRLEKVIQEGGTDAETRKALAQAQKDLAAITKQYGDLQNELTETKNRHESELLGIRIESEMNSASKGFSFKKELPQAVTEVILRQAVSKVKSMNPEFIDDGKGGKILSFKSADGSTLRNPENQLNPFTARELVEKELKEMGVLAETRTVTGTGTGAPMPKTNAAVSISGARTRVEAYDMIARELMSQGLVNGSAEFEKAMSEAYKANDVAKLPEK